MLQSIQIKLNDEGDIKCLHKFLRVRQLVMR